MADRCESRLWTGQSVASYLASYGFHPNTAAAFTRNFTEKEQAFVAQSRLIAAFPAGDIQLDYFVSSASDPSIARYGWPTADAVLQMLRDNKLDAVLFCADDKSSSLPPGQHLGGNIYLVTRNDLPPTSHSSQ